jgi:hemolysin activation/secretion protein
VCRNASLSIVALLMSALIVGHIYAEPVDPAFDSDVLDRRLRDDLRIPAVQETEQPGIDQPIDDVITVASGPTFQLTEVIIDGSERASAMNLEPVIARYLHREISIADLHELADAIKRQYRRQGYVTTITYVPPQTISAGKAVIEVLEGVMGDLIVEGQKFFNAERFRWYWPTPSGTVLQYQDIHRGIVRMNEHPDRTVQALLRAGQERGTTDVILKVEDALPFHLGFSWDHSGTKPIGRHRFGTSIQHNNLLNRDDQAIAGLVFGDHFHGAYAQYQVPITPGGTSMFAGYSRSDVQPQAEFSQFDVHGVSETYSWGLDQPLHDGERISVRHRATLELQNSVGTQTSGTTRHERRRVIRYEPRLRLNNVLKGWTFFNQEYSFGLDGLGATSENNPLTARVGAPPDFVKVRLNFTRVQKMPWSTRLIVAVQSQLTSNKLLPSEQLYMGGVNAVRGYPEGDYLADTGIVTRVDYLMPLRFLPQAWRFPGATTPLGEHMHVLGFVDHGYGRLRGPIRPERASRTLMSIGCGIQWHFKEDFSARIEWGWNIGNDPLTDDSPSQLHFSFRHRL